MHQPSSADKPWLEIMAGLGRPGAMKVFRSKARSHFGPEGLRKQQRSELRAEIEKWNKQHPDESPIDWREVR